MLANDWNSAIYRIKYLDVLAEKKKKLRKEMKETHAQDEEVGAMEDFQFNMWCQAKLIEEEGVPNEWKGIEDEVAEEYKWYNDACDEWYRENWGEYWGYDGPAPETQNPSIDDGNAAYADQEPDEEVPARLPEHARRHGRGQHGGRLRVHGPWRRVRQPC